MTTATEISSLLGDDGTHWQTLDGIWLEDLCQQRGGIAEYADSVPDDPGAYQTEYHIRPISRSEATANSFTRFVFADGSAIVTVGGCWDLEGSEPFVMAGLEPPR